MHVQLSATLTTLGPGLRPWAMHLHMAVAYSCQTQVIAIAKKTYLLLQSDYACLATVGGLKNIQGHQGCCQLFVAHRGVDIFNLDGHSPSQ